MAAFALRMRLRDGCGASYEEAHRHVPAAIEQALIEGGVRVMRIFRDRDELFMVLELEQGLTPDDLDETVPATDADEPWRALMSDLQSSDSTEPTWQAIDCVYELSTSRVGW